MGQAGINTYQCQTLRVTWKRELGGDAGAGQGLPEGCFAEQPIRQGSLQILCQAPRSIVGQPNNTECRTLTMEISTGKKEVQFLILQGSRQA